jgi:hypothetical protein
MKLKNHHVDLALHGAVGFGVTVIGWGLAATGFQNGDIAMAMGAVSCMAVRELVQAQYKAGGSTAWSGALREMNWPEAIAAAPGAAVALLVGRVWVL